MATQAPRIQGILTELQKYFFWLAFLSAQVWLHENLQLKLQPNFLFGPENKSFII